MKNEERKLTIAVIASQVSDIQQRQLLEGIIEQAHIMDINVAVFSNVYNPFFSDKEVEIENNIYNLIYAEKLDGIIVDEEPVLNEELKVKISELLEKRKDILTPKLYPSLSKYFYIYQHFQNLYYFLLLTI